jgi:hypothetical protein
MLEDVLRSQHTKAPAETGAQGVSQSLVDESRRVGAYAEFASYPIWGSTFSMASVGDCLGVDSMTDGHPTEFVCPECGSGYKVVRVKADADLPYRLIYCRVCKHPLTAMDGEFVLKYFLVRRATDSPRKKAPQGSGV